MLATAVAQVERLLEDRVQSELKDQLAATASISSKGWNFDSSLPVSQPACLPVRRFIVPFLEPVRVGA